MESCTDRLGPARTVAVVRVEGLENAREHDRLLHVAPRRSELGESLQCRHRLADGFLETRLRDKVPTVHRKGSGGLYG